MLQNFLLGRLVVVIVRITIPQKKEKYIRGSNVIMPLSIEIHWIIYHLPCFSMSLVDKILSVSTFSIYFSKYHFFTV